MTFTSKYFTCELPTSPARPSASLVVRPHEGGPTHMNGRRETLQRLGLQTSLVHRHSIQHCWRALSALRNNRPRRDAIKSLHSRCNQWGFTTLSSVGAHQCPPQPLQLAWLAVHHPVAQLPPQLLDHLQQLGAGAGVG